MLKNVRITNYEMLKVEEAVRDYYHKQIASHTNSSGGLCGNGRMSDAEDLLNEIGALYIAARAREAREQFDTIYKQA